MMSTLRTFASAPAPASAPRVASRSRAHPSATPTFRDTNPHLHERVAFGVVARPRGRSDASDGAVTTRAAGRGYGYGYGYDYGWSYGYNYGDPDWGGRGSSGSSGSSTAGGGGGLRAWWARAGKIDRGTLAALGGAALLSYGLISNLFYVSSLLGAMYTSVKVHAASPLVDKAAMQTFVTTYFGLWMIQNFLRPARMGLSVAISPWTDKIVEFFRQYVPGKKKPLAFALTVFCVNVLGTFAYMFGGFFLINALTGVPLEVASLKSLLVAGKAEVAAQGMAAK
jgi:hypothetical protein